MNNNRNLVSVGDALKRISAKKALLLSLVAFAALCMYRAYNLWTTGFFVSDEYGYIQNSIQGSIYGNAAFGYRVFIAVLDVSLFRLLGIHSVDSFIILLPFYLFLWGGLTLCSTYLILRTLEMEERIIKFTLFSCFFLVSFVLLSLGFLTEPVGLSLAMLGILFLLRFAKHRTGGFSYFAYPLFGALALGAARHTREPYALLLVGGVLVVLIIAFNQVKSSNKSSRKKVAAVAALAIVLYSGLSLYLLNNPVSLSAEAGPSIESFGNTLTHPVTAVNTTSIVSLTRTNTVTTTTTTVITVATVRTGTIVSNGTTTWTTETTSFVTTGNQTTTLTTTTVETTRSAPVTILILNNQIANTLWIFFAGIALGWGPMLFVIGLVGFILLTRRVFRQKDPVGLVLLILVLSALGSYLFVSYYYSPDSTYLSFGHYSTIIRLSDTALPAYLLTAPFAFAALAKRKHWLTSLGIILVIFIIVAIPTYETYAASGLNLDNNPFSLSYRSPGVQIRDYIWANPSGAPYHIMTYPGINWFWTPGNTLLTSTYVLPSLNQSQFVQFHWPVFYIYVNSAAALGEQFPYLFNANQTNSQSTDANAKTPFVITSSRVIFDNRQGMFIQLKASWPA